MRKLKLNQYYHQRNVRKTSLLKINLILSQPPNAQQLFPWRIPCVHPLGKSNKLMLLKSLQTPNRVSSL